MDGAAIEALKPEKRKDVVRDPKPKRDGKPSGNQSGSKQQAPKPVHADKHGEPSRAAPVSSKEGERSKRDQKKEGEGEENKHAKRDRDDRGGHGKDRHGRDGKEGTHVERRAYGPTYSERSYPREHDIVMTCHVILTMFVPTEEIRRFNSEIIELTREFDVSAMTPKYAGAWSPVELTGEGRAVLEAAHRLSMTVDEVDEAVLYITLPLSRVAVLGGNKGMHHPEVQRIGADCGARIWVPLTEGPEADRTVTLEGSLEQLRAGLGLVMDVLIPHANKHKRDELPIPGSAIGPVVGKEAKTLDLIKSLTGCNVEVKLGKSQDGRRDRRKDGKDKEGEDGAGDSKEGEKGKDFADAGIVVINGPCDGALLARTLVERLAGGLRYRDALTEAAAEHRAAHYFLPAPEQYAQRWGKSGRNPYITEEQVAAAAEAEQQAVAALVPPPSSSAPPFPSGRGMADAPTVAAGGATGPKLPANIPGAILPPPPKTNPWAGVGAGAGAGAGKPPHPAPVPLTTGSGMTIVLPNRGGQSAPHSIPVGGVGRALYGQGGQKSEAKGKRGDRPGEKEKGQQGGAVQGRKEGKGGKGQGAAAAPAEAETAQTAVGAGSPATPSKKGGKGGDKKQPLKVKLPVVSPIKLPGPGPGMEGAAATSTGAAAPAGPASSNSSPKKDRGKVEGKRGSAAVQKPKEGVSAASGPPTAPEVAGDASA